MQRLKDLVPGPTTTRHTISRRSARHCRGFRRHVRQRKALDHQVRQLSAVHGRKCVAGRATEQARGKPYSQVWASYLGELPHNLEGRRARLVVQGQGTVGAGGAFGTAHSVGR